MMIQAIFFILAIANLYFSIKNYKNKDYLIAMINSAAFGMTLTVFLQSFYPN